VLIRFATRVLLAGMVSLGRHGLSRRPAQEFELSIVECLISMANYHTMPGHL